MKTIKKKAQEVKVGDTLILDWGKHHVEEIKERPNHPFGPKRFVYDGTHGYGLQLDIEYEVMV